MEDMTLTAELELPGFRFHPTEEELLDFYLKQMVYGKRLRFDIIRFLNIYHHDPSELPGMAKIGEREWYFFVPRDRKHGSGGRPNRTTGTGFWKATGSDKKIVSLSSPKRVIGLRKTLVFYKGRAPRGTKTDWVMNEYRMPDNCPLPKDIVLCKIYMKATSLKVIEARVARDELEIMKTNYTTLKTPTSPMMSPSSLDVGKEDLIMMSPPPPPPPPPPESRDSNVVVLKKEVEDEGIEEKSKGCAANSIKLPIGESMFAELEVPSRTTLMGNYQEDWTQDSFWTQFTSPWFHNFTSCPNIF